MKRHILMAAALVLGSQSALAGAFDSIEDRAAALNRQLAGNDNYEAHLARELASIAEDEKSQHDIDVARRFMNMAEAHAAKAGGQR